MVWGNGFFAGAIYGQRLSSTLIGISLGHSLDMRAP
jgi:hypothetical protein